MHTRARPKHKVLDDTLYAEAGGVTADVVGFLRERLDAAVAAGVPEEATIVDPGPDFAKTPAQTVEVLREPRRRWRPSAVRCCWRCRARTSSAPSRAGRPGSAWPARSAAVGHVLGSVPALILRVHDVGAVADYLAVAAVLAGRAELPADARLAEHLRRTSG